MYNDYREIIGEEEANRRICMKFDLYYSPSLFESSKDIGQHRSRISAYISRCNLASKSGKTYDATIREEGNIAITTYEDLNAQNPDAEFCVTKDIMHDWGLNFSPSEYEFLENEY